MTNKLICSFAIGFFLSSLIGAFLVPFLRRIKAGQEIRSDGPTWHMSKSGTPTMGGIMFIAAVAIVCLTVGFPLMLEGEYIHIFVLVFSTVFGLIGFLDDYQKLRKKQNLGLTAKAKFLLQTIVAVIFVFLLWVFGYVSFEVYLPFWNITFSLPPVVYCILAAFVIVGAVNSVNLTDGVDGLATGTSLPVMLFYVAVCVFWGNAYLGLGLFASGLLGALLGFLLYNFNPAKVFMGDTGSLFLGGAVCALAFAYDMPLILVTLGLVFIIETLSDIIQVAYFKISHGKRVFKMAPFHHHLEMGGWTGKKWSEKELFVLFTGVSLICAVVSFVGIYGRF